MFSRLRSAATSNASGAAVAQAWQAVASFLLQVLASHYLGKAGLGVFALAFGVIVFGTALTSGVVGDSLTVLDRHDRSIRAGLQLWTLVLCVAWPIGSALVLVSGGVVDRDAGIAFAIACGIFQIEEIMRRIFMAGLRFWWLVVVDSAALVGSVGTLLILQSRQPLSVGSFFVALAVGQLIGTLVAVLVMAPTERYLVSLTAAGFGRVAGFGLWRGAQVAVNPAALTAMRTVLIAVAGAGALGQLEAARILVAPATLIAQGLGSYLLASYARDRSAPISELLARATRASRAITVGTVVIGLAMAGLSPYIGHFVTGRTYSVEVVAVLAWILYSAAGATMQPFASLAASRGQQRKVFFVRLGDVAVGLGSLSGAVALARAPVWTAPIGLAVGLVFGGFVIRRFVLRPLVTVDRVDGSSGDDRRQGPSMQ